MVAAIGARAWFEFMFMLRAIRCPTNAGLLRNPAAPAGANIMSHILLEYMNFG